MPDKWAQYAVPSSSAPTQDKWAQYAVSSAPASQPAAPSIADNPNGEGTYVMWNTSGQKLGVPYSKVSSATAQGYKFDTNPDQSGMTPQARFQKDFSAKPYDNPGSFGDIRPLSGSERFGMNYPVGVKGESAGDNIKNFANDVGSGMWNTIAHPIDMITGTLRSVLPGNNTPNPIQSLYQGLSTRPAETIAPMIGQTAVMAPVADLAAKVPGAAKGVISGDVNAPIPGTNITPAARYSAMKSMGINPDAAQATNSGPLRMVKAVNQNSLFAAPTYDTASAGNIRALNDYTSQSLYDMSPHSPEEGGAAVQSALLRSHSEFKKAATEGFQSLDDKVGDQQLPGALALQQQAQVILDQNNPYYRLHPELEPTKAVAIVRDLANGGKQTRPGPPVIQGFGAATATPPKPTPPRIPTYTELHRLRSDLLDFNNTNPDLVKNQANGWISQLAGAADNAITSGEGALKPDQVQTFREANDAWKWMKDNYDSPQSPLYSAVRTQTPSTLVNGISRTPEMAQKLNSILEPSEIGPIQRGVAEKALGTTKEGNYNFRTFQGQFNKLPQEYRQSLYTPDQQAQLDNIGQAGTVLNIEPNPSGTAKVGQKMAELGAAGSSLFHPFSAAAAGGYHVLQYVTAKAMNSPSVVDALMSPARKMPRSSLYAPVIGAGVAAQPSRH